MKRSPATAAKAHPRGPARRPRSRIDRPAAAKGSAEPKRKPRPKPLEQLLEAQRSRIEQLECAQKELVSVVSHDLRNPLSVILVSSRLLLRSLTELGPRRQVEAILRGADEINLLIQELVDATHIEAGELSVGCEPHEVRPIVDRALQQLKPLAEQKPLELRGEVAPDLPRVLGDKERIHQVLANLVCNAMKFTPKGGLVTVTAELSSTANGHSAQARFAVSDNGPGIPDGHRESLFARTPHGANGSRRSMSQASGLSVFVAKGIVEAQGGKMWVESEVGRGSTFYFTVPAET